MRFNTCAASAESGGVPPQHGRHGVLVRPAKQVLRPSLASTCLPSPSPAACAADAKPSEAIIQNWWRQGMMGGAKAHYDGIVAFSQTDFTEDLKKITCRSW